ncbi:hypothetical protein DIPPA_53933 [Diplonema papillatum]|nr:hypothetical protein DIPPA_53933 [Diplonema papillatum]
MLLAVCADLYADKVNLELSVNPAATVQELRSLICRVMDAEAELLRPPNYQRTPFDIHRLQIFNDQVLKWVDLVNNEQLHDGVQLYAFQPQTQWHTDVQKDLPPPRPPTWEQHPNHQSDGNIHQKGLPQHLVSGSSATHPSARAQWQHPNVTAQVHMASMHTGSKSSVRRGTAYETGRDGATEEEKVSYLFDEMDVEGRGALSAPDFIHWLRELIDVNDSNLQLLFDSADVHRRGLISKEEFRAFAKRFPNVSDIVFHRAADRWDVCNRELESRAAQQQMATNENYGNDITAELERLEQQKQKLLAQLSALEAESEELTRTVQTNQDLNTSVRTRQSVMHLEEKALMEKEIAMERNREALRDSEMRFLEQSQRFDMAAASLGSPRRSRQY